MSTIILAETFVVCACCAMKVANDETCSCRKPHALDRLDEVLRMMEIGHPVTLIWRDSEPDYVDGTCELCSHHLPFSGSHQVDLLV